MSVKTQMNPSSTGFSEIEVRQLKLTAALYATRPAVVKSVKATGLLPVKIELGGGWIGMNILIRERGTDISLRSDEQLVFDAIIRSRRLPGGSVILGSAKEQDAMTYRTSGAPLMSSANLRGQPLTSLYTNVERLVISALLTRKQKFRLRSLSDASAEQRPLADALASLGLAHEAKQYDRLDAAVGQILLRDIACRLPRLPYWRDCRSRSGARGGGVPTEQHGRLHFAPQHLFTITWPSQGPGLKGPIAYHRVWMPVFDGFVVTASEPTDGPHGYCDFALGSFADAPDWQALAGDIIYNDWLTQFGFWGRKHRAEIRATGIVRFEFADRLAERAWVAEHRVYYSKQLTPQAPRAATVARAQRPKSSLNAKVLRFHHTADRVRIAKSGGEHA